MNNCFRVIRHILRFAGEKLTDGCTADCSKISFGIRYILPC